MTTTPLDRARGALRDRFGFGDFRGRQGEVVAALLDGRSALAVFPTGGGKSLCYQLPALLLDGLTVVVSPLIALMKDQIDFLHSREIPAARLDSTLTTGQYRDVVNGMKSGSLKLLYVAPERLANEKFLATLKAVRVALLAIDEAHCISEWGHNFRPDYMKLARLAGELSAERVLALTATATPKVAADIAAAFAIEQRDVVRTGVRRPNLELRVTPAAPAAKLDTLADRLTSRPAGAAVVYVTRQKAAESVADELARRGLNARAYHAGMDGEVRAAVQDWFMAADAPVVVATVAFGMGIDKADIRYVYHHDLPKSLEDYSQQVGRAGRDGGLSVCELLAAADDRIILENFTYGDTPERDAVAGLLADVLGRGPEFDVSTYELSAQFDVRPLVVNTLLTYLELDGVIRSVGAFFSEYRFQAVRPSAEILKRFDERRAAFLRGVFAAAKAGRTWLTLDVERAAAAAGADRQRVVAALGYLEERGDLVLRTSGARQGYRRLTAEPDLDGLTETMAGRFADREAADVGRIGQVLAFAGQVPCRVGVLTAHFGEPLDGPCGHCDVCLGEVPRPLPDTSGVELTAGQVETVKRAASMGSPALRTPRQVARFLSGLSSPALTREKLTRSPDFGALQEVPFAATLRAAEAVTPSLRPAARPTTG